MWVQSRGREDPLEEGMATHSSIPAWRIPMDRGAWHAEAHRVTRSRTWLEWLSMHSTHKFIKIPVIQWWELHPTSFSCILKVCLKLLQLLPKQITNFSPYVLCFLKTGFHVYTIPPGEWISGLLKQLSLQREHTAWDWPPLGRTTSLPAATHQAFFFRLCLDSIMRTMASSS